MWRRLTIVPAASCRADDALAEGQRNADGIDPGRAGPDTLAIGIRRRRGRDMIVEFLDNLEVSGLVHQQRWGEGCSWNVVYFWT
jgi:hypothetical protein